MEHALYAAIILVLLVFAIMDIVFQNVLGRLVLLLMVLQVVVVVFVLMDRLSVQLQVFIKLVLMVNGIKELHAVI